MKQIGMTRPESRSLILGLDIGVPVGDAGFVAVGKLSGSSLFCFEMHLVSFEHFFTVPFPY